MEFKLSAEEKEEIETTANALDALDKLTRLHALDAELIEAQRLRDDAKELYKTRNAAVETANENLLAELRKAPAEPLPLIDGARSDVTSATKGDDAWRNVPIADLGLKAKVLAALADVGISNIGGISDWSAKKPLTDIKGIGEAKALDIDEALTRYWKEHPQPTITVSFAT